MSSGVKRNDPDMGCYTNREDKEMQEITKYKAEDGREFLNKGECEDHEHNCLTAFGIMSALPSRPDGCDFSNGSGYLQHDKDQLLLVRNSFLEFAKRYTTASYIQQTIDKGFDAHASRAGRVLSEALPNSIYKHWYRFETIGEDFREWGQPYYANNPDKATQKQLN